MGGLIADGRGRPIAHSDASLRQGLRGTFRAGRVPGLPARLEGGSGPGSGLAEEPVPGGEWLRWRTTSPHAPSRALYRPAAARRACSGREAGEDDVAEVAL